MQKRKKRLLRCMMISLCLLLMTCLPVTATVKTPDVKCTAGGYLLSEQAMQDVVTGWTADKEAVKILWHGLTDLNAEISAQAEDTRRQLTELKQELAAERKRYNVAIRRSRGQGLLIGVIIGVVTGAIVAH